jgi:hypothetical protein
MRRSWRARRLGFEPHVIREELRDDAKAPRGESSPRSTSRPVTGRSPSWREARRRCGSCAAGAAGDRSTWR